jgi:hypothetical protein
MTWLKVDDVAAAAGVPVGARREVALPAVMAGSDFLGCSDWSGPADHCVCETWRPVECGTCRQRIRDGQEYVAVTILWDVDDPDGPDWEAHHVDCWNERGA